MKKIVVATGNKGKIKEFKELFKEYDILTLNDFDNIDLKEDGKTFKENALVKASQMYDLIGEDNIYIADDSGICIDALDGFPGLHTARWLIAEPRVKNIELQKKLIGKTDRTVHYHTAIAIKSKKYEKVIENILDGKITEYGVFRGENGFGFDEIFELENGRTLAELSLEEKLEIAPRSKALKLLKEFIESNN